MAEQRGDFPDFATIDGRRLRIVEFGDYVLEGECNRCGDCCRAPGMPWPNEDDSQCRYLIFENVNDEPRARCAIWPKRPVYCALLPRNFPGDPPKGECGFKWVKKSKE